MNDNTLLPVARQDNLVVQELPGELLIYDLNINKAYCLNDTSRRIWELCDGRTTLAEARTKLAKTLFSPVDNQVIFLALAEFEKQGLIVTGSLAGTGVPRVSRRSLMNTALKASIALPLVAAVAAPASAQAAGTCIGDGNACENPIDCCSGLCDSFTRICGCTPDTFQCNVNNDCCGQLCNSAGVCGCVPDPGECSFNTDCCDGLCNQNFYCGCIRDGDSCATDNDCCSGSCFDGFCSSAP